MNWASVVGLTFGTVGLIFSMVVNRSQARVIQYQQQQLRTASQQIVDLTDMVHKYTGVSVNHPTPTTKQPDDDGELSDYYKKKVKRSRGELEKMLKDLSK